MVTKGAAAEMAVPPTLMVSGNTSQTGSSFVLPAPTSPFEVPLQLFPSRLSTSVRPCAYRSRQTIYSPNLDPQIVFPDLSCTHLTNLDSGGAKSPDLLRTASVSLAHFLSIFTSILSFRNIAL
ncbi:hypothetical protein LENED_005279 [Lentinula edodes]|uniref:Uncharacterized protein n=1 Tax=Lentinula edodes TaxID=5353 RepID=A0A1Q3E8P4_LENED|nr:hypothetical protein LENED_005279 [Lentinula edodes]